MAMPQLQVNKGANSEVTSREPSKDFSLNELNAKVINYCGFSLFSDMPRKSCSEAAV